MAKTYAETSDETKRELLCEFKEMLKKAADAAGRGEELDRYLEKRIAQLLSGDNDDLPLAHDENRDDQGGDEPV